MIVSMKLTRTTLAHDIQRQTGISYKKARAAVDAVLNGMAAALAAGDKVMMPGLGRLVVKRTSPGRFHARQFNTVGLSRAIGRRS